MIKDQPNRLAPRRCRTPTLRISRDEGRLGRVIFVFRRDLYDGLTLDIQPTFAASPNTLRGWSDQALSHTHSLLPFRRALCKAIHRPLGLGRRLKD